MRMLLHVSVYLLTHSLIHVCLSFLCASAFACCLVLYLWISSLVLTSYLWLRDGFGLSEVVLRAVATRGKTDLGFGALHFFEFGAKSAVES